MDAVIEAQPFGPRPLLVAPQKMGLNPGTLVLWGSGWAFFWGSPIWGWLVASHRSQSIPYIRLSIISPWFCPRNYYLKKKKTMKIEEVYGNDIHPATQSLDGNCAHWFHGGLGRHRRGRGCGHLEGLEGRGCESWAEEIEPVAARKSFEIWVDLKLLGYP